MADCIYTLVSFTIAELFEKVWETPMVKLAQDIGVSDVAVARACRKAGIPLPGRGSWAKQEKQRPRKPKLPAMRARSISKFSTVPPPAANNAETNSPTVRRMFEVPSQLTEPHTLVSQWLKCGKAAKLKEGYLNYAGKRVLNAMISSSLIERSAILFDARIKESEAEG
ncbi:hypothetical protein [Pseudomonas alvandae]|uniref:hypothetical protein n=1 Tax=Pseudomonas canavaninivorans TaxID=2842348 RepID=UPI002B1D7FDD|nr:hypothetical protein [Pseudomonas canavaninivorans]